MTNNLLYIKTKKNINKLKKYLINRDLYIIDIDENLDFDFLKNTDFKAVFIDDLNNINVINLISKIKSFHHNIHIFIISNDIITLDLSYAQLLEIKGTAHIIFSDKANIITKEKSIIPIEYSEFEKFIYDTIDDEYFSSKIVDFQFIDYKYLNKFNNLTKKHLNSFNKVNSLIFGTIALRTNFGFITTIRGKTNLLNCASIFNVDFQNKIIYADKKGSLNIPLLFKILNDNPNVDYIVHSHECNINYDDLEYAMPGTIMDSNRNITKSFNIKYHGSFDLYDNKNNIII